MSNSSAVSVGRILISNDDGLDAIGIACLLYTSDAADE